MKKLILGVAVIIAAVAVVGLFLPTPTPPTSVPTPVDVGAVPGPVFTGNDITVGGVTERFVSAPFNTASTTVCALRSPVNSSSTLVYASLQITTATSSAASFDIAKDPTPFATTTKLTDIHTISAYDTSLIVASTSPVTSNTSFSSGNYLVVKLLSSAADNGNDPLYAKGFCVAKWITRQ
jgi:hypothetical protein